MDATSFTAAAGTTLGQITTARKWDLARYRDMRVLGCPDATIAPLPQRGSQLWVRHDYSVKNIAPPNFMVVSYP